MQRVIQKYKSAIMTLVFIGLGILAPLAATQMASAAAVNPCARFASCDVVAETGGSCTNINQCDLINTYINPFVDFLSIAVGLGVVTSIVIGGIQYSSSAGDPSKVSAAKSRIRNAIIALIAFVLLYAMLNFLIPGGLI